MDEPRLRHGNKLVPPPYPLNQFPKGTVIRIAAGIIYLLHTRRKPSLEGDDWESIFAEGIGAEWKPSNLGLDDVRLDNTCWGAKTVKQTKPSRQKRVRLISGRNSLDYSYKQSDSRGLETKEIGRGVLGIWNERVSEIRQRFKHCRTVVLLKSNDLSECAMFEFETVRYDFEKYDWSWNPKGNLVGIDQAGQMRFTWQPHGAQFTIVEDVPASRVAFRLRIPTPIAPEAALKSIGFDESWVTFLT